MSDKLTVTGTGDSLFVSDFPREYDKTIDSVADFIKSCDIRLTNLETNLSDFEYFAGAYSGGTWLNTRRTCLADLCRYGFNYFGTANNHCMDYSFNGLLSTIDTLDKAGLAHSGTGRSFDEACAPAILEAKGRKVAVFAVDASFNPASKAGKATPKIKARPGVNYLRHNTVYSISPEEMEQLRKIAARTHVNFSRDFEIATGYLLPDAEGEFCFDKTKFTIKQDVPTTSCHPADLKRITEALATAKKDCDYAFVLVHCHDNDGLAVENPPAYLREFAHACIEAGANAIFGGGCHRLRGMEMYQGAPIFYSLGDFIYQGLQVEHLPADFLETYGVPLTATAAEALFARSKGNKIGLHCNKKNYQTVLPKLEFADGKLAGFALLPVALNFERKDEMNGLPEAAQGQDRQDIFELLQDLSAPFGVKLRLDADGLIRLA